MNANSNEGEQYVNRHAKAASAGSIEGNGNSRGLLRRALATRGASRDSKGSGASSSSHLRSALAVLALTISALALSAASASAAPLEAKIGAASEVLGGSAHITGELDPGGPPDTEAETYFTFEYSTDNVNWSGFNFEGYETGEGFRTVSTDLKGLKAGTKYFVRLTTKNFLGPDVISPEPNLEFETLLVTAPSALAVGASQVGITAARLTGEVLRPSPANPDPAFDAKCTFEYITDAQFTANEGNSAPGFEGASIAACNHDPVKAADGPGVETIITGLAPATTYHLRLSVSNAGGADSKVAATFTTEAIAAAPTLAVNPAGSIGFSKAQISGTVNPNGGNPNPVGGPVPIAWELQYTRADEPEAWVPATSGWIEGPEAESSGPVAVPVSPQQLEGLHSGTEYKFRLLASYAGVQATPVEGSFETEAASPPSVSIEGATAITTSGAHFAGHVNPGNADPAFSSSCEFDYVTEPQFQAGGFANPGAGHLGCDVNPVEGNASVEVKADAAGLLPGTVYHLRLRAENQAGPATAVAATFETEPVAPLLSATAAHEVTATAATLNAQVNPGGDPTTYRFEYLTQARYEADGEALTNATSTPETPIGEDTTNHLASAPITGLAPDTAYAFRAVATNSKSAPGGTPGPVRIFRTDVAATTDSCPNAEVRAQQGSRYLPDCRAYEMVSPALKNGFDAGAPNGGWRYAMATADGNGILYGSRGPMGETNRGLQEYTVGRRGAGGWSARSALPPTSSANPFSPGHNPIGLLPSADLTKLLFSSTATYVPDNPDTKNLDSSGALYLGSEDARSIDWLTRPQIPNPSPPPGNIGNSAAFEAVGGSPDLSTLYFTGFPTLLPSDAARTGHSAGPPPGPNYNGSAWGLYEYSNGTLKSAGTLPDGTEDPGGAAPASAVNSNRNQYNWNTPETFGNQVSRDGSTLFFVSPDPGYVPRSGPQTQLYVRRGGHSTLVSHGLDGKPAPSGAQPVFTRNGRNGRAQEYPHQYAFGSADGSTAIFQSTDALTANAPAGSSLKSYRYDVATDAVTYLPGVDGATVLAASDDGQRFLFGDESHIGVWDHGTIKTVSPVGDDWLAPARATASGSAFVFTTLAPIAGFNNGGTQIYRYDLAQERTICVSCPPDDVVPSGATMVPQSNSGELIADRGMSADADRIFFETFDPLVPGDTNTQLNQEGLRFAGGDVYEWTPTRTSLISSGHRPDNSRILDISASGDDVFFATTEGLDAADTDGSYDVYDARVGGGFLKPEVTPCAGEECRSSASASPGSQTAATNSFAGAGNPRPCAKGKVRRHGDCVKQKASKNHHKKSHKRAGHNRGGAK